MNKIIYIIMAVLTAVFKIGSGGTVPEQVSGRDGDIVFVRVVSNYAWGYTYCGSFVDTDGNVYSFDFSDDAKNEDGRPFPNEQDDRPLIERLEEIRKTEKPERTLDAKAIDSCAAYIPNIDTSAEMKTEFTACDAGQRTIYAVTEDGKLIEMFTEGDNTGFLDDKAAKKIVNSLEKADFFTKTFC